MPTLATQCSRWTPPPCTQRSKSPTAGEEKEGYQVTSQSSSRPASTLPEEGRAERGVDGGGIDGWTTDVWMMDEWMYDGWKDE